MQTDWPNAFHVLSYTDNSEAVDTETDDDRSSIPPDKPREFRDVSASFE